MYFVTRFYSNNAWESWQALQAVGPEQRIESSELEADDEEHTGRDRWLSKVCFPEINTFQELLERLAFLQLMNKRYVLYFRGKRTDFENIHGLTHLDLPSLLRAPSPVEQMDAALLHERWIHLTEQAEVWREILREQHPRPATLRHFPESIFGVQQHYKDLLRAHLGANFRAAETMFLDISPSPRVAAAFALPNLQDNGLAYVSVVALPQTTGSLTYCAEDQLQILRLSALCPPSALRPHLQEAFLVSRLPAPDIEELNNRVDDIKYLEEFYSLRRRIVGIIPIRINENFWGNHGNICEAQLLACPWFQALDLAAFA